MSKQKIAIIGTGISGLTAAYLLHRRHDITVYEANDYIGGHTNTIDVASESGGYAIDTGFIVFNLKTYPNFVKLLKRLDVDYQETSMSFSVRCEESGLEYGGTTPNTLFAQRKNIFRPSFYRMIYEMVRFNYRAPRFLSTNDITMTLGEYLETNRYSRAFIHDFITPLGAAIWSTVPERMLDFPAFTFIQFFNNHGFLNVTGRPGWYSITGGSREYVKKLTHSYRDRIRLRTRVRSVRRFDKHVTVTTEHQEERFDTVIIAVHSDQALAILEDPSPAESAILGSIPYQENTAVLHTDSSLLPSRKRAWGSWNYHRLKTGNGGVSLTYNMKMLQNIDSKEIFCVTLNEPDAIEPGKIIKTISYHHPLFTEKGIRAQARKGEISGTRNTYYCGAYWQYGFHEDGVKSALEICRHFGEYL